MKEIHKIMNEIHENRKRNSRNFMKGILKIMEEILIKIIKAILKISFWFKKATGLRRRFSKIRKHFCFLILII